MASLEMGRQGHVDTGSFPVSQWNQCTVFRPFPFRNFLTSLAYLFEFSNYTHPHTRRISNVLILKHDSDAFFLD